METIKDITNFKGGVEIKRGCLAASPQVIKASEFDYYRDEINYFDPLRYKPNAQITVAKTQLVIDIDNESIAIDARLEKIAKEIEESKYILELDSDWDSFNAKKIDKDVWLSAVNLLSKYAHYILTEFSTVIQSPEINPVSNGTIDLSWRTKNCRFLMNVKGTESNMLASYYGDLYNNEQPIKDKLVNDSIIKHLAYWMRNLA
ncbi:MAG: hypothetical protein ABUL44_02560 [Flavobacterium sp.]